MLKISIKHLILALGLVAIALAQTALAARNPSEKSIPSRGEFEMADLGAWGCEPILADPYKLKGEARLRSIWDQKISEITQKIRNTNFIYEYPDKKNVSAEWRDVADLVHSTLSNYSYMADFSKALLEEVLENTIRLVKKEDYIDYDIWLSSAAVEHVYRKRAQALGWDKIVWTTSARTSDFFEMLARGEIFLDRMFVQDRHTIDGHFLQILALTPVIDEKFGLGTMRNFLKYLGRSREGQIFWDQVFDLGPGTRLSFHAPSGFYDFGVARALGSSSLRPPDFSRRPFFGFR